MKISITTILFILLLHASHSQTLGGNSVFNFLKLPSSPLLTAAGGVNVSYRTDDAGLAANNPSLLFPELHSQSSLSFNNFLGGIKTYSLSGAYHYDKYKTTFGGQVYFLDYGSIPQTDAAGNESGNFRPVDFVIQLSAGRRYLEKWNYGATIKFINSSYQQYKSSAIALDAGIHFSDTSRQLFASAIAKNMGVQIKTYSGEHEDLPFDLQIGITKKLAKAPFGFSLTAQHLQRFNILYNDTSFNNENQLTSNGRFFNKLLNHFVVAGHIYIGNQLEATVGFNHLRRTELNLANASNGLNGFSMGLRVKFSKLQILYARSNYQRNIAYNQLGLNLRLNKIFGWGEM